MFRPIGGLCFLQYFFIFQNFSKLKNIFQDENIGSNCSYCSWIEINCFPCQFYVKIHIYKLRSTLDCDLKEFPGDFTINHQSIIHKSLYPETNSILPRHNPNSFRSQSRKLDGFVERIGRIWRSACTYYPNPSSWNLFHPLFSIEIASISKRIPNKYRIIQG